MEGRAKEADLNQWGKQNRTPVSTHTLSDSWSFIALALSPVTSSGSPKGAQASHWGRLDLGLHGKEIGNGGICFFLLKQEGSRAAVGQSVARQPVGKGQDGETRPSTLSQEAEYGKEDTYFPGSYLRVHSESRGWVQVVEKAVVHPGWEHRVASLSGRV